MLSLRQYILSVATAGLICAVTQHLCEKNGSIQSVLRIVTGLLLMFTVLQPLADVSFDALGDLSSGFSEEAQDAVAAGKDYAKEAISAIIKERTEAYILDKAAQYDAQLDVEIILNDDEIPVPVAVRIRGDISPYAKQCVKKLISSDLGISEEKQTWM